jgi:hypothetical protein
MKTALTKDVMILTALELNLPDLIALCRTSQKVNEIICKNDTFWFNKVKVDFGLELESLKGSREYYLEMDNRLKTEPNRAYEIGINNEALPLIKLALEKGADPNYKSPMDQYTPLIRSIYNDKIFNYLIDKTITSKKTSILNVNDFTEFFNDFIRGPITKENKCKLIIKLFDKITPEASKYIFQKNYWKGNLIKLEEVNKECSGFKDTYNKWIDFYRDLAKD